MFTGIIESQGKIESVSQEGSNCIFNISAMLDEPLQVDQSIAHDGVCLTVTGIHPAGPDGLQNYSVTAIRETLEKTNLSEWKPGTIVNLERCLKVNHRLDGHFVQGHVDAQGIVKSISNKNGSWEFNIGFAMEFNPLVVSKGSICINGVSLTIVNVGKGELTVAIIPYTWEHTSFHSLKAGENVNLEFDILGKYFLRSMELRGN